MPDPEIASPSNPRIKRLVSLRARTARDHESVFVVEGVADIERATDAGLRPIEVYYDITQFTSAPVEADLKQSVATVALDRASYRDRSRGVIAVFRQFDLGLERLQLDASPLVLIVEGIEKPGNLGAILRSADAAGVDAVIVADPGTDVFNPNVIRASLGTLFTVPLVVTNLTDAVRFLQAAGVRIVAADPLAPTPLWSTDLTGSCALLIGSEHAGLSAPARDAAQLGVSIPMAGTADSLNASVASAVLLFEAVRQRGGR